MAREIVQYLWCDKHMESGDRREAETVIVRIGDRTGELDLCGECHSSLIEPLAALLSVHAKPLTTPMKPSPAIAKARTTNSGDWLKSQDPGTCPICGEEYARSYLGGHLRQRHDTTMAEIYGTACPVDGYRTDTFQGLTTHINKMHGRGVNAEGVVKMGREAGDPHGIVAVIDKRAAIIRQNQEALL